MTTDLPMPELAAPGLHGVPLSEVPTTRKDFASDQEVRWCPGCGDYIVLAAVQGFLPSLGLRRENIVFVSGHRLLVALPLLPRHLRAALDPRARPGDRDRARDRRGPICPSGSSPATATRLSIGGNHLIHAMRRNVNLTILLFNNRIYGLTKGQYSPTSEIGKVTKSTPMGSVDQPFNPISLALGAEATFVARTLDFDRAHLTSVLKAAAAHRGTSLVEIYQNCPIFNDGAFDVLKDAEDGKARLVRLEHGSPVRVGDREWIHDAHADNPSQAFEISRLDDRTMSPRADRHLPPGRAADVRRPGARPDQRGSRGVRRRRPRDAPRRRRQLDGSRARLSPRPVRRGPVSRARRAG